MSQGNRRILLVDDEPSIVEVLSRSLKKLGPGCEVVTATSGQEALARFQQAPFDLLITDVWMPDMDGIALTRAVRTLDADAAIVWLTAYHLSAAEAEGLGIFRHVRKPVTVDVIRDIARAGLASNPRPLIRPSGKRLILVLDDDDSVRRLFGRALASAGFEIRLAASLQEARVLLAQHRFDAFLCDVRVGTERGTDLLREQMAVLDKLGTQVVMVSSAAEYRALCEDMGIDFYIEKPVALPALITLVDRLTA